MLLKEINNFPNKLFALLNIEIKIQKNRIKIEVDENQRRTGYAFVEFDSDTDYETAFKADVKASNKYVVNKY